MLWIPIRGHIYKMGLNFPKLATSAQMLKLTISHMVKEWCQSNANYIRPSVMTLANYSVGHDWCKLSRTRERFPKHACDDKITQNDWCVIKIIGIRCDAKSKMISFGTDLGNWVRPAPKLPGTLVEGFYHWQWLSVQTIWRLSRR